MDSLSVIFEVLHGVEFVSSDQLAADGPPLLTVRPSPATHGKKKPSGAL